MADAYAFNPDRSKAPVYTKTEIDAMDLVNDQALAQEVANRQVAVNGEASARAAADNSLGIRIDGIIALPDGSTTADAELVDIRTGHDGTAYASAGDAVRKQVKNLADDLDSLKSWHAYTDSVVHAGKRYRFLSSSSIDLADYAYGDAYDVPMHGESSIKITATVSNNTVFICEMADGSYQTISSLTPDVAYVDELLTPPVGTVALHFTNNLNAAFGFKAPSVQDVKDSSDMVKSSMVANSSDYNYGIGHRIMEETTGDYNSAVGIYALRDLDSGSMNTGIGAKSGITNVTGSQNTTVGYESDIEEAATAQATAIGKSAKSGTGGTSIGVESHAGGTYGTSVGAMSSASGVRSSAVGCNVSAAGRGSVAIGCDSLGNGASAPNQDDFVLGTSQHNVFVPGNIIEPHLQAHVPGTTLGSDISPDLSSFTGVDGAVWDSVNLCWNIPVGGSIYTDISCDANTGYVVHWDMSDMAEPNNGIIPLKISLGTYSLDIYSALDTHRYALLTSQSAGQTRLTFGGGSWYGKISKIEVQKVISFASNTVKIGPRMYLTGASSNYLFNSGVGDMIGQIGANNTAVGHDAQSNANVGTGNTAIGFYAQKDIDNGSHNTALGEYAQQHLDAGMFNIGLGYASQQSLHDGCWNVAVGNESQRDITSGYNNVSVGRRSCNNINSGHNNVTIGALSGFIHDGYSDTMSIVDGYNQVLIGFQASQFSTDDANDLVAIGAHSHANTHSIAIGSNAYAEGEGSVAIGMDSNGNAAIAQNDDEIAIGTSAHTIVLAGKTIVFNNDGTVTWH